jgi:hypothetical protein
LLGRQLLEHKHDALGAVGLGKVHQHGAAAVKARLHSLVVHLRGRVRSQPKQQRQQQWRQGQVKDVAAADALLPPCTAHC